MPCLVFLSEVFDVMFTLPHRSIFFKEIRIKTANFTNN